VTAEQLYEFTCVLAGHPSGKKMERELLRGDPYVIRRSAVHFVEVIFFAQELSLALLKLPGGRKPARQES
jgi:hypothetical protein